MAHTSATDKRCKVRQEGAFVGGHHLVPSATRIYEGKGYRVYFRQQGDEIIFLLFGGDKKSQQRDIAKAQSIWKELGNET